jgi:hypothetical protein
MDLLFSRMNVKILKKRTDHMIKPQFPRFGSVFHLTLIFNSICIKTSFLHRFNYFCLIVLPKNR